MSLPQLVFLFKLDHGISNVARLGFHQVMTHCVGLRPIPLEVNTTCSLVKASVIDHGFYPLLAMVYKCFNIYLLLYRVYLEYLQAQVRSGEIW